jgi:hypothetical protein|tara:strand:+ start:644 stop:775 length:132 start_codon:yes stop_codon:yes gene_type:complete
MTTLYLNIFFSLLTAFLISYLAIPKLIYFAEKLSLLDTAGDRA